MSRVVILGLGIQLFFFIIASFITGVKRDAQNFIGGMVGQSDHFIVASLAGFGVFGQDFIAGLDGFDGLLVLAFVRGDESPGGEGLV